MSAGLYWVGIRCHCSEEAILIILFLREVTYLLKFSVLFRIHDSTSSLSEKYWVGFRCGRSISFSTCNTCKARASAAHSSALGIDSSPLKVVPFGSTLVLPHTKERKTAPVVVIVRKYMT